MMTSALLVPPCLGAVRLDHSYFPSIVNPRGFSQHQTGQYQSLAPRACKADLYPRERQRSEHLVPHIFPSARHLAAVSHAPR